MGRNKEKIDDNYGSMLDNLRDRHYLTGAEMETLTRKTGAILEKEVKVIRQIIFKNTQIQEALSTNDKLYLFSGLIMAGLNADGVQALEVSELKGNNDESYNDGVVILEQVKKFLHAKDCSNEKAELIISLLQDIFHNRLLWEPSDGTSFLHVMYERIKTNIIPCFESDLYLDYAGRILNSLNDYEGVANDKKNDVVLTPGYVAAFMARLARVNMDSYVWDKTMGSAGLLISAMGVMVEDAVQKISDKNELEAKIRSITENQILGTEILSNIFLLAALNIFLTGAGLSNILYGDSRDFDLPDTFPANAFLLNPPYSAPGKGFAFAEEALSQMTSGYAVILIQENAGSGQGLPYTKRILEKNTLEVSIKMPERLFSNKASVSVGIFVFKVGRPHREDDVVTFIDFSDDGYSRRGRKKSTQEANLRNTDHALERYDEVAAICLGKKPKTDYYTEANGKVVRDTITLKGDDWTFQSHRKINIIPTEEDFKKTVAEFLSFKVAQILNRQVNTNA